MSQVAFDWSEIEREGVMRVKRTFQSPIPDLSHLQFAVMWEVVMVHDWLWVSAKSISAALKTLKWKKSGPAFCALMSRLESTGMVKGCYSKSSSGRRERFYAVTPAGRAALDKTIAFYHHSVMVMERGGAV
jgi:hypothetical protein